jgi:hypothetical protein
LAEASEYRAQHERRRQLKAGGRISAAAAGYMELAGAKKDADCKKVKVAGGVSEERGCCNLFAPEGGAAEFRCGTCTHHVEARS